MTVPVLRSHLPALVEFTQQLGKERQQEKIAGWGDFIGRVRAFYTPVMMETIECVVPGWKVMASYTDEQTLIHVSSVLAALYLLPEYQRASPEQQALMEWMVLFHDVAKVAQSKKHDYIHGFRSAAIAGKALAKVGFPVTDAYNARIDDWFSLTHNAIIFDEQHGENKQNNGKLPAIISGIDGLYGAHAPAGLVIKGVLFHLSIATDPGYPTVAPLTEDETRQYFDKDVYQILRTMMLVDTDGWNFFDADERLRQRQFTIKAFHQVRQLIGIIPT